MSCLSTHQVDVSHCDLVGLHHLQGPLHPVPLAPGLPGARGGGVDGGGHLQDGEQKRGRQGQAGRQGRGGGGAAWRPGGRADRAQCTASWAGCGGRLPRYRALATSLLVEHAAPSCAAQEKEAQEAASTDNNLILPGQNRRRLSGAAGQSRQHGQAAGDEEEGGLHPAAGRQQGCGREAGSSIGVPVQERSQGDLQGHLVAAHGHASIPLAACFR